MPPCPVVKALLCLDAEEILLEESATDLSQVELFLDGRRHNSGVSWTVGRFDVHVGVEIYIESSILWEINIS